MKSVSDISCNIVVTVSPVPFSVREPKPDECFHMLKSKRDLKIQPVNSVSIFATEAVHQFTNSLMWLCSSVIE